jgi:hypothetical protein
VNGDILPTLVGIALVAAAAAFALLPFARGGRIDSATNEPAAVGRFRIYRQVLELEFDYEVGKLSTEDYTALSAELLAQAGEAMREERGSMGELDEEIEREIAAARTAFTAARGARNPAKTGGGSKPKAKARVPS